MTHFWTFLNSHVQNVDVGIGAGRLNTRLFNEFRPIFKKKYHTYYLLVIKAEGISHLYFS